MKTAELVTSTLVFCAVAFAMWRVTLAVIKSLHERLEVTCPKTYESLRRFAKPSDILSQQVYAALTVFAAVLIGQFVFGVQRLAIAIPVAAGFAAGAFVGVLILYLRKAMQRKEAFEAKILDFARGLNNSMRSGLALSQAIDAVAKHIGGPMQEELQTLLKEHRLGIDLPEAFERLYKRMPCEDLHLLTTTIMLTTRSGGSLVEVLEEMVEMIRARTEFHTKLKTMTASGRFEAMAISLAPLVAFVLLYFIDTELMRPLITTGTGWFTVGCVCALVATGYYVLRKMTTIEV